MAPSTTVRHRSLDGVSYRLTGPLDLALPGTSAADISIGGRLTEFTAGPRSLADDIAGALGITSFDSELSFRGGTLRLASRQEYEPRSGLAERPVLVAWQGRKYSLVTRLYSVTVRDVLGLLRTLGIAEHDDGITLTPEREAGSAFVRPATVIKEVPGLGLLEMSEPTRDEADELPPWRGAAVPSGELYRDTLSDGRTFFLLSGPRLRATLVPLGDTAEAAPDLLGKLHVTAED
ncbi:hypothetical protein GCM10009716_14280 [Streptomyces sodiiphilus]|uniref:Uncharacterized protein n=1 Tax=Streptomyces sodiiphilus TaxID=226217 RepID=A0ABN2NXH1_9ACTN